MLYICMSTKLWHNNIFTIVNECMMEEITRTNKSWNFQENDFEIIIIHIMTHFASLLHEIRSNNVKCNVLATDILNSRYNITFVSGICIHV